MNTKKAVFSKLFGKKPLTATQLKNQKVALGLVQDLEYDLMSLQDQSGLLSYLAYEWHDEKFEEYRQAWMQLNDEYTHNGSAVLRYDDVSRDLGILDEIKVKADELGLDANDVYDQWDEHYAELENMKANDEQYIRNEQEFRDWT
mgnify:FL=1|tara:strand:- start:5532 stop:5966 length:435 start_codon:yes stop_codon:yes gene_type:complete